MKRGLLGVLAVTITGLAAANLSLILISCATKHKQPDFSLEGANYIVDLDGEKEISIPLSSLFKRVKTIILETNKDCLIGRFSDIQVFDGYIYILDSRVAKCLLVFDLEGRFVRKIGGIGGGPGEYAEINAFTLDTENRMIYLRIQRNNVHKYKLDGTFIHSFTIQADKGDAGFIQFYNGSLYASFIGWETSKDDFLLLEIDPNNGQVLSQSLSIKYNKGWNEAYYDAYSRFFMSRANNPPRYNQMFMDYVVSIGKEITPYIELKSKNLTTEKDIQNFRGEKSIPDYNNIDMSSKLFSVHCFIENDDFICFRYGMNFPFVVILNKKNGDVKLTNRLNNDLIFKQDQTGRLGHFVFADAQGAYVLLDTQSRALNDFRSAVKNNEIVPDLDKLDELMKLEEDANPVILFYEFK